MEIQKYSYADPRIITPDSAYPIIKGASSQITHLVPSVNQNSISQQRYEFMSEGVDVFNALDVKRHMSFILGFVVTPQTGTSYTDVIAGYGTNFSLCADPLGFLDKTHSVSINGVPLTAQQTEFVQSELLRLQPVKNSIFQTYPSNYT